MSSRTRTAIILIVLFFAAWVPRVVALDSYVSIDERKWLARSANFYMALQQGDLANTFQREHPGVTVMWAGTLGLLQQFPEITRQAPGYFTWNDEVIEAWLKANTSHTPLELLAAGRWWIVLGVALLLALAFLPLRRLLGEALAAIAVLFLAWMPWSVALSRQLHPDGAVSVLIFVSFLFFLAWLYTGRRFRDLLISGIVMGLGWLTKTPAAFLVPIGAILVAAVWWQARRTAHRTGARGGGDARSLWGGYVIWGVIATATFFVLWPAMWLNPIGALGKMAAEMEEYVGGHVNPNFFMGAATSDPGLFFYPIAYLYRITPATLLGLIAAALAAWRRWAPLDRPLVRRTAGALLLFTLLFMLFMTIPAKKFDRYILPAFYTGEVLAALGWGAMAAGAASWWNRRRARAGKAPHASGLWVAFGVLAIGLIPLHSMLMALHYPYYLTYFNPVLGGSITAPKIMFVGWGEGLDAAARWINAQPGNDDLRVASWYNDGPLSYFLDGEAVGVTSGSSLGWLDNDYVILYVNQIQRNIPSKEAVDYYLAQAPVHTVSAGGIELARVYDVRNQSLPPFTDLDIAAAASFGDKIQLLAHEWDGDAPAAPGAQGELKLYLRSQAPMEVDYNILVRLISSDGAELWREEGWPWGAPTTQWPAGEIRPDGHAVKIPADVAPGLYKLAVSLYDPATLENLPVLNIEDGSLIDATARDLEVLRVGANPAATTQFAAPWQFGADFSLSGATVPATAKAGNALNLALQWDSLKSTPVDYTVFLHVVGPAGGDPVAQMDRPPLGGFAPTHAWTPGLRIVDDYTVALPDDLAPGRYEIRTGLYTSAGRLAVAQDGMATGDYAVVGTFDIP